jgi:hypothetical protein
MPRRAAPSLIATVCVLAAMLALGGCYTILKHPRPSELVDQETGGRKECYDCHGDSDVYHFRDPFSVYYYDYYPPTWYPYYARPWWYSDYWYDGSVSDAPPPETGGRHVWSRPGEGAQPRDASPPGIGTLPPASDPGGKADSQPPRKEEKKEQNRETGGRHQWARGGKGR